MDTGTVTYSVWQKHGDTFDFNVSGVVVPITASDAADVGITLDAFTAGDVAEQHAIQSLVFAPGIWSHEHTTHSVVQSSAGDFTGGDGKTYLFQSLSAQTSWLDVTHALSTSGPGGAWQTETDLSTYGAAYHDDATVTDGAANFSTATVADPAAVPTDLFNAPAGGTTFLIRSFDSGSSDGTATRKNIFGGFPSDANILQARLGPARRSPPEEYVKAVLLPLPSWSGDKSRGRPCRPSRSLSSMTSPTWSCWCDRSSASRSGKGNTPSSSPGTAPRR